MLEGHRDAGQPLCAVIVRGLIRSFIRKREPSLLENKSPSGFKVSQTWSCAFV